MCKAVHVIVTNVCMYVQANQNDVDKQIAHPKNTLCYARGKTDMLAGVIATVPMAQYEYSKNAIKPDLYLTTNSMVCPPSIGLSLLHPRVLIMYIHYPPAYSNDLRS